MKKITLRICIAIIAVCLVLAITMICMALLVDKPDYHPASTGKHSTDVEPAAFTKMLPTTVPIPEPTEEPIQAPQWPTGSDVYMGIVLSESANANADVQIAFLAAVNESMDTCFWTRGTWEYSTRSTVDIALLYAKSQKFDAVIIFPTEGENYDEVIRTAYANGTAVHMMSSEDPAVVFDEICALYGRTDIVNGYKTERPLVWPTDKNTVIGVAVPSSYENSKVTSAIFDAIRASLDPNNENDGLILFSAGTDLTSIQQFYYQYDVKAVIVYPDAGENYVEYMRQGRQIGKPVHIITCTEPSYIFDEICGVFGKTGIENPYRKEMAPWATDPTTKIGVAFNGRLDIEVEQSAVVSALNAVTGLDLWNSDRVIVSNGSDVGEVLFLMKYEGAKAVMFFPIEGMDYTAAYQYAAENGIVLHMFSSEDPVVIFNEICVLYGKNLSVPQQWPFLGTDEVSSAIPSTSPAGLQNSIQWPTHDDPWFYCFYPSGQYIMFDELRSAIMDEANGTKNRELCGESVEANQSDWSLLEKYGDTLKDFEGIFVITQAGVDYSPLIKWCADNNKPLYFFEADTRKEIRAELAALYA